MDVACCEGRSSQAFCVGLWAQSGSVFCIHLEVGARGKKSPEANVKFTLRSDCSLICQSVQNNFMFSTQTLSES